MRSNDPAFQWETEAARERAQRRSGAAAQPTATTSGTSWVTLREGHEATGIPIETLRKWARKGAIRSELEETEFGERRMVDLGDVRTRARHLGRNLEPAPTRQGNDDGPPPTERPRSQSEDAPQPLHDPAPPDAGAARSAPSETVVGPPPHSPEPTAPPSGTMIVPIDAWDKMLMQLGNLHEAGQQLAEARERAAKAETEARFLRERLAEFRADADRPPPVPAVPAAAAAALDAVTAPETEPEETATSAGREDETPATPPRMGEPWARVFRAYAAERWRERRRQ